MHNHLEKARLLCLGFFVLLSGCLYAQDQQVADSLLAQYRMGNTKGQARMELLRQLAFNESRNLPQAIRYAEELIAMASKENDYLYLHRGYYQLGNKKRLLGELEPALSAFIKSAGAAQQARFLPGEGTAYTAIADIFSLSNNHPNAMTYYQRAIATLRRSGDTASLASTLSNAGDEYLNYQRYDSALLLFEEAAHLFAKINHPTGKAYSMGNIGMVYANQGQNYQAETQINAAIRILEQTEDYHPVCVYLIAMSEIYHNKGNIPTALKYAQRSLGLAQQYQLKDQISEAHLQLSVLYEQTGAPAQSLEHFKTHIAYRDSVNNINSVQKIADLRTDFEVAQKQTEVNLLRQSRRNQQIIVVSLFIIVGLLAVLMTTLYRNLSTISREKKRSESLLLNILPADTAQELKRNGKVEAVRFEQVTVLFTDFVQFSRLAGTIEPEQLVRSIDYYFRGFDAITTKYGLEKIKTVGDSYMCAGGIPIATPDHARKAVLAAREMIELVRKEWTATDELSHFEVRIGLHTGPVVAGIVGTTKWQYDIWGDTVNIASRMESKSEPGKINISETTYQQIRADFPCTYRGELEVKNRGLLKMYFLEDFTTQPAQQHPDTKAASGYAHT
ncbi:Adenylate cyclase, class 3 [Cnuella takakiae]|uniref:Adenylate cyclase, class 3 n=1 Tax=Cnuella takakiae TaxID=1302690 RepID=A0A1M5BV09_9BACT|nr:adenylate/guanylate cyclase domain-containing protein [Cnuella takakiae]OLY93527.1 adenylate/guanylate cyclase domain-containing protein [Cnuella takakiae]SHF46338.1 Adenylate cyclase, class 3 [Cnuella takakiae]